MKFSYCIPYIPNLRNTFACQASHYIISQQINVYCLYGFVSMLLKVSNNKLEWRALSWSLLRNTSCNLYYIIWVLCTYVELIVLHAIALHYARVVSMQNELSMVSIVVCMWWSNHPCANPSFYDLFAATLNNCRTMFPFWSICISIFVNTNWMWVKFYFSSSRNIIECFPRLLNIIRKRRAYFSHSIVYIHEL